jgi:lysophospholipase L1-like esterase
VSAVVECLNGLDIVVERSMYWANGTRRGGHNSQAVEAPAGKWYLAEGSTGFFDTFVLIANPDGTASADVRVTFLREDGTTVSYPAFTMPPSSRWNIWVNAEVPALANKPFSTVVESVNGVSVFVERAMYFGGNPWEGGHGSTGVTSPSATWFFGEGFTGGSPSLSFDTFLLLSNPGTTAATATVTFLREGAPPIPRTYSLLPTSRQNIWVDLIAGLESAAFSMRVESDQPVIAERAEYWGPAGSWLEAHNSPGVTGSATKWAFAEGAEDGIDASGLNYDSYYLVANPSTQSLALRATFVREDGTGVVQNHTVPPQSRFTLPTSLVPELSNQRFAAFFESTNGVAFAAERAMYWGGGYFGGHGSAGTPWTGAIATPPSPPLPAATSMSPATGPTAGGTPFTITGTNFRAGSTVTFGGAPAPGVVTLNATTITGVTPAHLEGFVDVTVTSGGAASTLSGAFVYVAPILPMIGSVSPSVGPTTGSTLVTVKGTNFVNVTSVTLGGSAPSSVTVVDPATITFVTKPHAAGAVELEVQTGAGTALAQGAFTYQRATAANDILGFGDSNTAGYTATSCGWIGVPPNAPSLVCTGTFDAGYPGRLQSMLSATYPTQSGIIVANAGKPGEWAADGVSRLPSRLTPAQDLVVIMEGVNDLNAGQAPGTVASSVRTMVRTAKSAGKLVFLGTVLPCVTVTYDYLGSPLPQAKCDNALVSDLNQRLRTIAGQEQVTVADFHESFTKPGINTAGLFSADGLHPNESGYHRMADLVRNLLVPAYETVPPIVP